MNVITTSTELAAACEKLAQSDFVTVDTEFLRETTFWPELCLIQMASPELAVIVDPLADDIDLKSFFELMSDTSVVKVFHAARQDLEIVYNLGEIIPHPLFDTQIAAMVCGYGDSISYDQLVKRITKVQLDKSSRFTNWKQRPLTDTQLEYAIADVTHLRDVYLDLKEQLSQENRSHWVREEMDILEAPGTYNIHPDDAWKRLRMRVKKPIDLAVMQRLAAWREREARNKNVPRGRILKDDSIYELAQQKPRDTNALIRLRTIHKGFERSSAGQEILSEIEAALAIPEDQLPKLPKQKRTPEGAGAASELLKVLLKLTAENHGVAPKVIANADDIERIAVDGVNAKVAAMSGWRKELFGDQAISLINGELVIRFKNQRVETILADEIN